MLIMRGCNFRLTRHLKSCNGSKKGKLKGLHIHHTELLTLDPVLLPNVLESISFKNVTFSASSVAILQQHISSNASLKRLYVYNSKHIELLLLIAFRPSSLEMIHLSEDELLIENHTIMNLLMNNSNLKELELYSALELPTSTLCDNTSLEYLANHVRIFLDLAINKNFTIQKIEVTLCYNCRPYKDYVLGMKTTNNSKIIVDVYLSPMFNYKRCSAHSYTIRQLLLLHIPEQYHHYIRIHIDV